MSLQRHRTPRITEQAVSRKLWQTRRKRQCCGAWLQHPTNAATHCLTLIQAEAASQLGFIQSLGRMSDVCSASALLLSMQRSLLGEVHPELLQASIEAEQTVQTVRLRFEYDGTPSDAARESCSCAATEVIADFPAPWQLDEQHVEVNASTALQPSAHVAYRRAEPQHAA